MSVCKYDIELFGLIEEIEKRVNDKDKYKVMNWISYLLNGVQSHNLQRKMNRNLYAINLLDNVINNTYAISIVGVKSLVFPKLIPQNINNNTDINNVKIYLFTLEPGFNHSIKSLILFSS